MTAIAAEFQIELSEESLKNPNHHLINPFWIICRSFTTKVEQDHSRIIKIIFNQVIG